MNILRHCQKDIWCPTEACLQGKRDIKTPILRCSSKKTLKVTDYKELWYKKMHVIHSLANRGSRYMNYKDIYMQEGEDAVRKWMCLCGQNTAAFSGLHF